ncbi:MAG: hypothetical protein AABO58_17870 [Acidobacteriota bacterium]
MNCGLCGSEEVYRGLDRRRRFWLWYLLLMFSSVLVTLAIFAVIAIIVIPFTGERVCANCGVVLT